uniref:Uncharacterized protein n=1 Tax=Globisporangium ultimum (strain ATCC 200006 / CBS 805.95 / DAOM BR144) TaxID=431595 RepID=K3WZC5_GLOUD
MKRERSTSALTHHVHVRASSIEITCGPSPQLHHSRQPSREDFSIVHKRLRGLTATASAVHGHHHLPSNAASLMMSSTVNAAPLALSTTSTTCVANGTHQSSATQLQFYGFYSTTAFDRSAISPAEAIILAAEMAADFYSEASMLYDMLSEIKTPSDEVRAVDELMKRMNNLLNDDTRLPKSPTEITAAQVSNVRNVYNGLVRVYIFLFQRYYREFMELEVSELLAASWQRLLALAAEYKVLEEDFILKVLDYVVKLVNSVKC